MSMMTKDAFGHAISFESRMIVGHRRRDGKYPVKYVFASSGQRFNKLMTKEAIDADIRKSRMRGSPYTVVGYAEPPKTAAELDAEIAEAVGGGDR
jgi:hypothetical protein